MIHFVVHDEHDSVGVVVVEGVKAGQQLNGWIMDQDKEHQGARAKRHSDRPQARHQAAEGERHRDQVRRRYRPRGGARSRSGEHVHVHNMKTKRW